MNSASTVKSHVTVAGTSHRCSSVHHTKWYQTSGIAITTLSQIVSVTSSTLTLVQEGTVIVVPSSMIVQLSSMLPQYPLVVSVTTHHSAGVTLKSLTLLLYCSFNHSSVTFTHLVLS